MEIENIKKVYLIDTENHLPDRDFKTIPRSAVVVFFVTDITAKRSMKAMQEVEADDIRVVRVHTSLRNAADVLICEYIYQHVKENNKENFLYYIVSDDTDFDPEIKKMAEADIYAQRIFLEKEDNDHNDCLCEDEIEEKEEKTKTNKGCNSTKEENKEARRKYQGHLINIGVPQEIAKIICKGATSAVIKEFMNASEKNREMLRSRMYLKLNKYGMDIDSIDKIVDMMIDNPLKDM